MHKILVIRLYFPLDALHVSDCISPSSGAYFYKLYIAFGICRYHSHTTATRIVHRMTHLVTPFCIENAEFKLFTEHCLYSLRLLTIFLSPSK